MVAWQSQRRSARRLSRQRTMCARLGLRGEEVGRYNGLVWRMVGVVEEGACVLGACFVFAVTAVRFVHNRVLVLASGGETRRAGATVGWGGAREDVRFDRERRRRRRAQARVCGHSSPASSAELGLGRPRRRYRRTTQNALSIDPERTSDQTQWVGRPLAVGVVGAGAGRGGLLNAAGEVHGAQG